MKELITQRPKIIIILALDNKHRLQAGFIRRVWQIDRLIKEHLLEYYHLEIQFGHQK